MKIVTIKMDLVIDDDLCEMTNGTTGGIYNKDCIADYLNTKLYNDPEFFGDFGPENIDQINLEDGTPVYSHDHGYYRWVKDNVKK